MAQEGEPEDDQADAHEGKVSYRWQFVSCRKCDRCMSGGPSHGPYLYTFQRRGQKIISRYIGMNPPEGVTVPPRPVWSPRPPRVTAIPVDEEPEPVSHQTRLETPEECKDDRVDILLISGGL
jgi:hypothetical protein